MARHSVRLTSCALLAGAALCLAGAPLHAQPAPSGHALTASDMVESSKRADALFKKGKQAYAAGKLQEAYEGYLQAFDLKKSHDICSNLANTEALLGRKADAANHLARCVRDFPATEGDAKRKKIEKRLRDARAEVGAVRIAASERGAEVFIDGRSIGMAPIAFEVYAEPGEHVVEAKLALHATATAKVVVVKGGADQAPQDVMLTLLPLRVAAEARPGTAPAAEGAPAPAATAGPVEKEVTVTLAPERRNVVPGAVLGGVAGAALVTGIAVFAAGRSKGSASLGLRDAILGAGHSCVIGAANFDDRCADVQSMASGANTLQKVGVGLLIGAGAAAAGTVIYFVLPSRSGAASNGSRATATLSPSIGGLLVSGTF